MILMSEKMTSQNKLYEIKLVPYQTPFCCNHSVMIFLSARQQAINYCRKLVQAYVHVGMYLKNPKCNKLLQLG